MRTLRFRNDATARQRLWPEDAMQHPAKGNIFMWQQCLEFYSQPGDVVLDPMSGIGTTMLAALMGRNVVCVELEAWMVEILHHSWAKMRQHPMMGFELGQVEIHQGDARDLSWLPQVSCILTSPPYEGALVEGTDGIDWTKKERDGDVSKQPHLPKTSRYRGYTRPSLVLTSPPYEEVASSVKNTNRNDALRGHPETAGKPMAYTRPSLVLSSPPYEGTNVDRAESLGEAPFGGPNSQARGHGYTRPGSLSENIGNLRSTAYWIAMHAVYAECYRILRPGGILCLAVKGFTRDHQYVDLPQQTSDLCESLGFMPHDHWRRELASLSFWRILQATDKVEEVVAQRADLFGLVEDVKRIKRVDNGKLDARLRYEEVLALRKPDGLEDAYRTLVEAGK